MGFTIQTKAKATQKQLAGKTAARRERLKSGAVLSAALSSPAVANDLVPNLKVVQAAIDQLKAAKRRPRKAGKNHIANVAKCIKAVGQVSPILIDRDYRIVDGHVVVEAMKLLGQTHVSAVCLDHLDEDQVKMVQIALNKLAEGSTWELEELRPMLEELQLVGYDLTVTGLRFRSLTSSCSRRPSRLQPEPKSSLSCLRSQCRALAISGCSTSTVSCAAVLSISGLTPGYWVCGKLPHALQTVLGICRRSRSARSTTISRWAPAK